MKTQILMITIAICLTSQVNCAMERNLVPGESNQPTKKSRRTPLDIWKWYKETWEPILKQENLEVSGSITQVMGPSEEELKMMEEEEHHKQMQMMMGMMERQSQIKKIANYVSSFQDKLDDLAETLNTKIGELNIVASTGVDRPVYVPGTI